MTLSLVAALCLGVPSTPRAGDGAAVLQDIAPEVAVPRDQEVEPDGLNDDLQENSRWGATLAQTLDKNNSLKLYFNSGVTSRTGTNFNAIGIAWQYRWGAGL